jgi:hypothetical protein
MIFFMQALFLCDSKTSFALRNGYCAINPADGFRLRLRSRNSINV